MESRPSFLLLLRSLTPRPSPLYYTTKSATAGSFSSSFPSPSLLMASCGPLSPPLLPLSTRYFSLSHLATRNLLHLHQLLLCRLLHHLPPSQLPHQLPRRDQGTPLLPHSRSPRHLSRSLDPDPLQLLPPSLLPRQHHCLSLQPSLRGSSHQARLRLVQALFGIFLPHFREQPPPPSQLVPI